MEIESYFDRLQILYRPQIDHSISQESIINFDISDTNKFDQKKFEEKTFINSVEFKIEKRVRFADECGEVLETIQILTESSDFFRQKNNANIFRHFKSDTNFNEICYNLSSDDEFSDDEVFYSNSKKHHATWKINFIQPASDYIKFRENLEKNKIALENIILRNDSGKMFGTIKVANLSFEKRVFLRFTSNEWKNFIDCPGIYQSSFTKSYDTFEFECNIPKNEGDVNKIEISVCYISDGIENWDSNNGQNYSLISEINQPISLFSQKPKAFQAKIFQWQKCDCDNAHTINYDKWLHFNNSNKIFIEDS